MIRYAVTYMKVKKSKEGKLEFEGPTVGPIVPSMQEANERTRTIVQNSRNVAVFPKVLTVMEDYTVAGILEACEDYYSRLRKNILESREITDKPIKRSK